MKDFIYSEKFDNYLKGKLRKDEKLSFEEELRQDPLLRNEVKWQQEIYRSLTDARRTYLKNRLDQIPVNSGAWYNFTGMQWAAVISSFFILAGGSYYYFSPSESSSETEQSIVSVDITVPEKNQQIPFEEIQPVLPSYTENALEDESLTALSEMRNNIEVSGNINKTEANASQKQETEEEILPSIVRPDVFSPFNEESLGIDYSDFEAPDKTLLQKPESSVAEVEIETVLDSEYTFHYQLFNHKLYLYGDFQGIPYKIIALNKDDTKKLFLEFNGHFYTLRQEQEEITPLEIIKDSTMINALIKLSH
jgi:hypothetical protein